MLTTRDLKVVDWLTYFKCAKTTTIKHFHYPSLNVAQKRLKKLYDEKYLGRCRDSLNMEYIYYIKKTSQIRHDLLLTDFYSSFSKLDNVEIIDFKKEITVGNLRSDGLVAYKHNDKNYIALLEIQLKYNKPDIDKYTELYKSKEYKKYMPVFPKIIFVTNRTVKKTNEFKVITVNENLSDINKIILQE